MRKHGLFLFGFDAKNSACIMEVRGLTLKGKITMMKAIKNFMNKPITWGDSFKWSSIILGLYAAVIGVYAVRGFCEGYKEEHPERGIHQPARFHLVLQAGLH